MCACDLLLLLLLVLPGVQHVVPGTGTSYGYLRKTNSEVLKAPGYLHVPGSTCTRNSKLPSLCLSRKNCKSSCFENRRGESKGTTIAVTRVLHNYGTVVQIGGPLVLSTKITFFADTKRDATKLPSH